MADFTPGPWSYRSKPYDDWGVVRAGRYIICQARDPHVWSEDDLTAHRIAKTDPWEANAHLIAAAPDMLAALTGLEGILATAESNASGNPEWEAVSAKINAARAAIAKATGK